MVKGKIWGTVCGEYREIEIDECDVIVVFGFKVPNGDGAISTQAASLGYGLTVGDFVTSVVGGAAQVVLDTGDSPEEKKAALCLLAEYLKIILREAEN